MSPFPASRMWHEGQGQPYVELYDAGGNLVNSFNLNMPEPRGNYNVAVMMPNGHIPERTLTNYADGYERDEPHGYRYYAHLYYAITNASGRALCVAVINHLMAHRKNTAKFWPYRDALTNWHICKLDEDPDIDGLIENRGIGYTLTLSLKGVRREYILPSSVNDWISDFNAVGGAYIAGDHVHDFGSVAAVYVPGDKPAYFSECPSKGEPDLPDYD